VSLFGPSQPPWDEWLAIAARQREWEYRPLDHGLAGRFHGYPFDQGGTTRHVLLGDHDGRAMVAFQHEHTTTHHSTGADGGWSSSSRTHRHAVVALHLGMVVPPLTVTPTSVLQKLFGAGQDIVVGDPVFDAVHTVRSPSPEFAWDVLTAAMPVLRQWRPMSWGLDGDSIVVHSTDRLTIQHVDAMLVFLAGVVDSIPERVWQRLRGEPGSEAAR
jgi:hypothetical protein